MPLDDIDLRAALDAATSLASDPAPSIDAVLCLLRDLIACASVSFNDMALASGDYRYVISPAQDEVLAERLKPEYDRYVHQHPLIAEGLRRPGIGAIRFRDVPDGDRFPDTDLYRNFYEPFGLRYQLAIQLPGPPDVVIGYALNRPTDQREFSDRDVEVLNLLAVHLALHHRVLMDRERTRAHDAEGGRGGWTVVTVRSGGVVEAASSSTFSASLIPGERVPPNVAALLPNHGSLHEFSGSHDVVVGDERWRCVVSPVPFGPTVLSVRHLERDEVDAAALLGEMLTARQIEVALLLAESGGTNAQLAQLLEISESTVKKHLESVFRALGVDSRAAAVAAVRALLP